MSAYSIGPWEATDVAVLSRSGLKILLPARDIPNFSQITADLRLAASSPQLVEALDPGPLGMEYQLELAAKVMSGEVPAESADCEGLAGYLRTRLAVRREALLAAGVSHEVL